MQIPWRRGGVICEMNGFLSQRSLGVRASVLSIQGRLWSKKAVVQLMKEPPQSWRLASEVPPPIHLRPAGQGSLFAWARPPGMLPLSLPGPSMPFPAGAAPCPPAVLPALGSSPSRLVSEASAHLACLPPTSPSCCPGVGRSGGMGGEREHSLAG